VREAAEKQATREGRRSWKAAKRTALEKMKSSNNVWCGGMRLRASGDVRNIQ
jgi:hypothetical protein